MTSYGPRVDDLIHLQQLCGGRLMDISYLTPSYLTPSYLLTGSDVSQGMYTGLAGQRVLTDWSGGLPGCEAT